ncbi:MAG TPA: alpha/beta hydrolase [Gemmatimonadales bacterium]|nr:alpha/beta hydrolase [Gemmatimonadales bacterium]
MTDRGLLYCRDLGAACHPIVFLPGVGGTTRYWASRVEPLAIEHRIRLVDLLGFGHSPKPWLVRYSVERHLDELDRVLKHAVFPDRFTLVGHSFGAIMAVAYAARWPERVRGLVLFSLPNFGGEQRAIRWFRQRGTAEGWLLSNAVLAAITCLVTRRVVRRVLPRLLPDMPREVVEDLVAHTWRSSTSTLWEGVYRHDVFRDAVRVPPQLPVLLIHGDQDTTAPLAGVTRLVDQLPHWSLRVLPGVDHHPFLRQTTACIDALRAFLEPNRGLAGSDET